MDKKALFQRFFCFPSLFFSPQLPLMREYLWRFVVAPGIVSGRSVTALGKP